MGRMGNLGLNPLYSVMMTQIIRVLQYPGEITVSRNKGNRSPAVGMISRSFHLSYHIVWQLKRILLHEPTQHVELCHTRKGENQGDDPGTR